MTDNLEEKPKKKRRITPAQIGHVAKYTKNHYDGIHLNFPKGSLEKINAWAAEKGISKNELFKRAITAYTGIDCETDAAKSLRESEPAG